MAGPGQSHARSEFGIFAGGRLVRGRKPAPAALRLMKGRAEGRDSGGRQVVSLPFRRVPPTKPVGMTRMASAHWDFLVGELERNNILTPLHSGPLQMMCETYSRWKQAEAIVTKEGVTVRHFVKELLDGTQIYSVRKHPVVTVAEAARRDYMRMAVEFGLTPSAEGRVKAGEAPAGDEDNPFE